MKVVCQQEDLRHALALVTRANTTRAALPVLSNVLMSADGDELTLSATNLDIGITTSIPATVEEAGKSAVDARLLTDFVNALPTGPVSMTGDPVRYSVAIKSGRDQATITGVSPDDFPVIATLRDDAQALSLDPATFREMVNQVAFAAAQDDSRPVLAGVLIRFTGDRLVLAASDGFRMAVREDRMLTPFDENMDVIVPARAVRELGHVLQETSEPFLVQITPSQSQFVVQAGKYTFVSRLIEGIFPDYNRIIPADSSTRFLVDRASLVNAVKRSSFFARETNDVLKISIVEEEEGGVPSTIEVAATAAERGNSQGVLDAEITGPPVVVGFNARFLSDALGAMKGETVRFNLNGQSQAVVLKDPDDSDYTSVIMPMTVGF